MSRQLWRPATESDGIPLDVLLNLIDILNQWKDEHLQRVGVPSNFAAEWDFVSAVSACKHYATVILAVTLTWTFLILRCK